MFTASSNQIIHEIYLKRNIEVRSDVCNPLLANISFVARPYCVEIFNCFFCLCRISYTYLVNGDILTHAYVELNIKWLIMTGRKMAVELSTVSFHENPLCGRRVDASGPTDWRTERHDKANTRFSLCFAEAPKNLAFCLQRIFTFIKITPWPKCAGVFNVSLTVQIVYLLH